MYCMAYVKTNFVHKLHQVKSFGSMKLEEFWNLLTPEQCTSSISKCNNGWWHSLTMHGCIHSILVESGFDITMYLHDMYWTISSLHLCGGILFDSSTLCVCSKKLWLQQRRHLGYTRDKFPWN